MKDWRTPTALWETIVSPTSNLFPFKEISKIGKSSSLIILPAEAAGLNVPAIFPSGIIPDKL